MHKSRITVDLPSAETDRRMGPIEWLRSLFGAQIDLRSGREELTVGAAWLVEGLVEAFAAIGVRDVVSFLVDKQAIYVDIRDDRDDLPQIVKAAEAAGVLDRSFQQMHLVLAHHGERLHTMIECTIQNGVLFGQAEMTIALSSRLRELAILRGETARGYAARVRAVAARAGGFEPTRRELDELTGRIADELTSVLAGARVTRSAAVVEVVRPDARRVGRFSRLGFGDRVAAPSYATDPFRAHYRDPYHDLASYVLVDAIIEGGALRSRDVHVVDPEGRRLFTGDAPPAGGGDWACAGAVSFTDGGGLEVRREIAECAAPDEPLRGGGASFDDAGFGESAGSDGGSDDGGWSDGGSSSDSSSSDSSSSDSSSSSSDSSSSSSSD